MKIATSALREALKTCAPAISGRPAVPILAAVAITSDGKFSATDYETWISTSIVSVETPMGEAFEVAVSHKLLTSIASVIKAKEVELIREKRQLKITAGRSEWLAPAIDGDLPAWPQMPEEVGHIDADALRKMVSQVAPAAGTGITAKPGLTPIQIETVGDYLRTSASDSYRIHIVELPFTRTTEAEVKVNPPAARLPAIVGSLSGDIALYSDGSAFAISDDTTTITMRTIDADMPNLQGLISKFAKPKATTVMAARDLLAAIKAAEVTMQDRAGVLLTIDQDGFAVASSDDGASASIPVEEFEHNGPGLAVVFDPHMITPALVAVGDVEISIAWAGPTKPAMITGHDAPGVFYAMPVNRPGVSHWLDDEAVA